MAKARGVNCANVAQVVGLSGFNHAYRMMREHGLSVPSEVTRVEERPAVAESEEEDRRPGAVVGVDQRDVRAVGERRPLAADRQRHDTLRWDPQLLDGEPPGH